MTARAGAEVEDWVLQYAKRCAHVRHRPGRVGPRRDRRVSRMPRCTARDGVADAGRTQLGTRRLVISLPRRELISYYANGISHLCGQWEDEVRERDALPSDTLIGR